MDFRKHSALITMLAVSLWAVWFVFISTVAPLPGRWWAFLIFHALLLFSSVSSFVALAIRLSKNDKMILRRALLLSAMFIVPLILQGIRCFNLLTLALLAVALILIDFMLDKKSESK